MQEEPGFKLIPMRDIFDWSVFFIALHAVCLFPFLRSKQGSRKPGLPGLVAFAVVLPIYACYWESDAMIAFWWVWLAMNIYRRTETLFVNWRRRRKKQRRIHSLSEGFPWFTGKLVFWTQDERTLLAMEPLVCLLIGWIFSTFSLALGYFVMSGFLSLGLLEMLYRQVEHIRDAQRDDDISDLEWESARYGG